MRIEGQANQIVPLRLAGVQETRAASPPVASAPERLPDSYNFEAVYAASLKRVPWTRAHQRLDQLRAELVAAKTQVPIHFSEGSSAKPANPYASVYMRITASPADLNGSAVEQFSTP